MKKVMKNNYTEDSNMIAWLPCAIRRSLKGIESYEETKAIQMETADRVLHLGDRDNLSLKRLREQVIGSYECSMATYKTDSLGKARLEHELEAVLEAIDSRIDGSPEYTEMELLIKSLDDGFDKMVECSDRLERNINRIESIDWDIREEEYKLTPEYIQELVRQTIREAKGRIQWLKIERHRLESLAEDEQERVDAYREMTVGNKDDGDECEIRRTKPVELENRKSKRQKPCSNRTYKDLRRLKTHERRVEEKKKTQRKIMDTFERREYEAIGKYC